MKIHLTAFVDALCKVFIVVATARTPAIIYQVVSGEDIFVVKMDSPPVEGWQVGQVGFEGCQVGKFFEMCAECGRVH